MEWPSSIVIFIFIREYLSMDKFFRPEDPRLLVARVLPPRPSDKHFFLVDGFIRKSQGISRLPVRCLCCRLCVRNAPIHTRHLITALLFLDICPALAGAFCGWKWTWQGYQSNADDIRSSNIGRGGSASATELLPTFKMFCALPTLYLVVQCNGDELTWRL